MSTDEELRAAKTALAEVRRELQRLREQEAGVRATLSHQLRTPLNAILGWAEVLLGRAPANADARRGLETIARNARAQAQMIDDLLHPSPPAHPAEERPRASTSPPAIVAASASSTVTLAGATVLVIDDEPDALALLELVLADAGARVVAAATSEDALAKLAAHRPDVIVSDISMPDRDGYQLMRSIRIMPPDRGGRTPAVALTGLARSEDRTRALLAGYQVHITKPVEPRELVATLASLTGRT